MISLFLLSIAFFVLLLTVDLIFSKQRIDALLKHCYFMEEEYNKLVNTYNKLLTRHKEAVRYIDRLQGNTIDVTPIPKKAKIQEDNVIHFPKRDE